MTVNGYIKLYRSMLDWEWFSDSNTLTVFLFCLLSANHKPNRWQGIEIKEGQFVTSVQSIKSKTRLSIQSVRTSLKHLKSTGEITIKTTSKYSLVTIVNWASYQSEESEVTSKVTNEPTNDQQTTNKQLTTNKNDKNDKKDIYGDFQNVKLTKDELEKLKSKFPDYQDRIEKLSAYVASTGKRYSSHYATILNWSRKEEPEREVKKYNFKKA